MPIPLPTAPLQMQRHAGGSRESEDDEYWGLPDSIKLGLGDFIFYRQAERSGGRSLYAE